MAEQLLTSYIATVEQQIGEINQDMRSLFSKALTSQNETFDLLRVNLTEVIEALKNRKNEAQRLELIHAFHSRNLELIEKNAEKVFPENYAAKLMDSVKDDLNNLLQEAPQKIAIHPSEPDTLIADQNIAIKPGQKKKDDAENAFPETTSEEYAYFPDLPARQSDLKKPSSVYFKKHLEDFLVPVYLKEIESFVNRLNQNMLKEYHAIFMDEGRLIADSYNPVELAFTAEYPSGLDYYIHHLEDFRKSISSELEERISNSKNGFIRDIANKLPDLRKKDYTAGLEERIKLWQNTWFALFEDWRFREHLFLYINDIRSVATEVGQLYTDRITSSLLPELKTHIDYINTLQQEIPSADTADMETLHRYFSRELYKLKKDTGMNSDQDMIREAAGDIPEIWSRLEVEILDRLEKFPKKTGVVNSPNYVEGIKRSEINYFSPREFIEFECLPEFKDHIQSLKQDIKTRLEAVVAEFAEYSQIIDFYLDSAISLTRKEGITEEELILIFNQGLDRLLQITAQATENIDDVRSTKKEEVTALIDKYLMKVRQLDDNNNIISIYSRLLRSRAIAESKEKRNKVRNLLGAGFTKGLDFTRKHSGKLLEQYQQIRKKLLLDHDQKHISSEISNYLADVQKRIFTLPVIYQHLFANAPVKEFNLFLSREIDVEKINLGYADWLKDNYAATLITGENGSGKTSLLTYYAQTLKTQYKVTEFRVAGFYHNTADYYRLLGEIFNKDGLDSDEKILSYINSLNEKQIVIVDGLERLFLRKMHGFECLHKFLSLLVATNHKIFWICAVSAWTGRYLNKIIGLSEHFDYSINIDSLSQLQIREIVLKRNRLSGFRVSYDPVKQGSQLKTDQKELENNFFNELSRFAGSNISLALYSWLQSIREIEDNKVHIGEFVAPDFSFLENFSQEKVYTLLLVVMHGKLTVEQHANACNQQISKSSKILTMLKEDSVLVRRDEYFMLNGILYRHVIRLLHNKNLIH